MGALAIRPAELPRPRVRGGLDRARLLAPPPLDSARAAGLRYVRDDCPGITRRRVNRTWQYFACGKRITGEETLSRIRGLAIPPAWTDVWICPHAHGHIQATGRDARGRKQYRYHERWFTVRDATKYHRTIAFAQGLPAIRARVERDLARPGLPREKVLAAVVKLLELTLIRVGNEEYARTNGSFGLTTMRDHHVQFDSASSLRFRFRGKSGKDHEVDVHDRRIARIVKACQDVDGDVLFQYVDDKGEGHVIESGDVNAYLREIAGQEFTAKDFRTWAGTVLAARALTALATFTSATHAKRNVVEALRHVSRRLGNTPAVCRRCYVHPEILSAYMEKKLARPVAVLVTKRGRTVRANALQSLSPEETQVLRLLRRRMASAQLLSEPLARRLAPVA